MIDGANRLTIYWRIILPLLRPAIATVVIIKGIAIYNEFYIPFLYMPSRGPRGHLDLAVPVQGPVRRAVGGHRRRHDPRDRPDAHRLPAAAAASSTTASPQEPPSDRPPAHRPRRPRCTRATLARRLATPARAPAVPVPASRPPRDVPATVPGCVHTDLLAAGLIPDPYLDDNEPLLGLGRPEPTGSTRTTLRLDRRGGRRARAPRPGLRRARHRRHGAAQRSRSLGSTANMHRTYRFDVVERCCAWASNDLVGPFRLARRATPTAQSLALGYRPQVNTHPFNAIRKIGVQLRLGLGARHRHRRASGEPVRARVLVDRAPRPRSASRRRWPTGSRRRPRSCRVHVEIERTVAQSAPLHRRGDARGRRARRSRSRPGASSAVVDVVVAGRRPVVAAGYGDQPLHDVDVLLSQRPRPARLGERAGSASARSPRDRARRATARPSASSSTASPCSCAGANWIPDDAFPHRVTASGYAARIAQAQTRTST